MRLDRLPRGYFILYYPNTRAFIVLGSTLSTRAAEHKGCINNWGVQVDWWLQSKKLCSAAPSVTLSGICYRNKSTAWLYQGSSWPSWRESILYYYYKNLLSELSFIGTIVWIYLEPSIASRFPGVATPLTTSNNLNIKIFNFCVWSCMMYRRGKKRIGWGNASICFFLFFIYFLFILCIRHQGP